MSESIGPLAPLIARMAETPETAPLVIDALKGAPPWRRPLMTELLGAIADARTPLQLFLALKETPAPPTVAELRAYLNFLIDRKFFDLAYYTWLQFLPPPQLAEVGLLFNGSFEVAAIGLAIRLGPPDWRDGDRLDRAPAGPTLGPRPPRWLRTRAGRAWCDEPTPAPEARTPSRGWRGQWRSRRDVEACDGV